MMRWATCVIRTTPTVLARAAMTLELLVADTVAHALLLDRLLTCVMTIVTTTIHIVTNEEVAMIAVSVIAHILLVVVVVTHLLLIAMLARPAVIVVVIQATPRSLLSIKVSLV